MTAHPMTPVELEIRKLGATPGLTKTARAFIHAAGAVQCGEIREAIKACQP